MRKSFTRLFGLFMLLSMLGFYAVAQVPVLSPGEHTSSTVTGIGNQAFTMTFASPVAVNSGAGIVSLNKWTAAGAVQLDPVQILNNGASSWQSSVVQANGLRSTVEIVNGNTVRMVFQVNLAEQAWYYITVSGDAFKVNGSPWVGIRAVPAAAANPAIDPANTLGNFNLGALAVNGYYEWEFQVEDVTPPVVTLTPADNSINVGNNGTLQPINTNLVMDFAEPVKINSVYNGVKTTIGLYDKDGNVVDMIYLRDDVTKTGLTAGGTITYTEPGSGKVYTVTLNGAMNKITIAGPGGKLSNLTELQEYYVRITQGAIVDMSGNAQANVIGTNNTSWNFTAADVSRPTVSSPISGKNNVERRPIITLNFADNFAINNSCGNYTFELQQGTSLYANTVTPGAFTPVNYVAAKTFTTAEVNAEVKLYDGPVGGPAIAYTVVSSTNNSISIRPSVDLPHFSDITVDVNPGATLQDGSGNTLTNAQITFNTGDFLPPLFTAVNNGRDVRGADGVENTADDIIKRNNNDNQNVDIILRTTNTPVGVAWNPGAGVIDIEDDQMNNGATGGSKAWTPLKVWAYAVVDDNNPVTPAIVPTPAQIKANGIAVDYVGTVSGVVYNRYQALNVSLLKTGNAAPDADYDVWFYAEDIAQTADADNGFAMQANENIMLASGTANDAAHQINSSVGLNNDPWEVKKLDFHTTDNKFDAPVMTFTAGTQNAVGKDAQIVFTFNEQVKSTNWQNALTITVPDNTFWPADADALPDVIAFNATLNGTGKILTIRELAPDRYEKDNGDPTLGGYDDFAELLSNTDYTITFLTGASPVNTARIHDDATGTISNGAAEDDDPGVIYGSDNYYSSIPPYTFKTVDYEGPVAFFNPLDNSGVGNPNNVPIGTQPTITFSEPIFDQAGAAITALTAVNHFELVNVATGANVIISTTVGTDVLGRPVVTLIPDPTINPLISETAYRIVITQLVYDAGGRALFNYGPVIGSLDIEGISLLDQYVADNPEQDVNAMVSVFETEDKVAPSVVITTVVKGGAADVNTANDTETGLTDVPVNAEIRLAISEGVREIESDTPFASLDDNTIRTLIKLLNPAGVEIQYNIIQVINGVGSGNNNLPTYVYIDPIDYPTQPLYKAGSGECEFVNSASYSIVISGLEDDNNNLINMTSVPNVFTVVSSAGPAATITLSSSIPANNAPNVALTQNSITLTFDQTVDNAAGLITLTQTSRFGVATGVLVTTLNVLTDVDMISPNKTVWRYDLPGAVLPLQDDAVYTINITQNSFETPRVGGVAAATWPTALLGQNIVFTTVDQTGPTITIDGINVVDVDADAGINLANFEVFKDLVGVSNPALQDQGDKLLFTFTDPDAAGVKLGTSGHLWIKRVDNGFTVAEWGVLSSNVKINAAKQLEVSIPGSILNYGTPYFVEMDGSFITDQDGNPFTYHHNTLDAPGVYNAGGFFGANKLLFTTWADAENVTFANFVPTTNWEPYQNQNQVETDISRFAIVFTGPAKLSPNITINDKLAVYNDITPLTPITSVPVQSLAITWSADRTIAYISVASIKAIHSSFNFVANTRYWIDIDAGVFSKYYDKAPVNEITDNAGGTWPNSVSGVAAGWYFSTWDFTPPTVTKVEPVTTVTNVVAPATRGTIGTDIKITFSEPIELTPDAGGNWANAISVTGTGTSVISGGNLDATKKILTLTMNPDFERNVNARLITVGINADADAVTPGNQAGIRDLATLKNDIIANANVGTFTIQDLREPIITQFNGINTNAGTSAKINITVDEASTVTVYASQTALSLSGMNPSSATLVSGTYTFDGTVANPLAQQITLSGLSECGSYFFYVKAVDVEGNISDNNANDADAVAANLTPYAGGALYAAAAVAEKMHDVTAPQFVSTYPAQGVEIPLYNTYYQIPASTATALKMYFDEDIIVKGGGVNFPAGQFRVREYKTNVDVGVTATVKSEVVATITKWYVEIVPTVGTWPAGKELYVECDYGILTDTDCALGANNEWTGALYGKDNTLTTFSTSKWWFKTGTAHVAPSKVAILNHDGTNLDGNQAVVFDPAAGANKGFITLRYDQPVQFVPGKLIYVYKYDDAAANPHEIITVDGSNVELANGGKDVKIYVRYLVNDLYKEHYRLVFEAGTILDANYNSNYGAADVTTKDDLTPRSGISPTWNAAPRVLTMINANNTVDANGLVSTDDNPALFVAGVAGNRADGPFIDFWALDATDPVAVWSSEWVTEWNGNRYYGPNALAEYASDAVYGDQSLQNNFPTRDVAVGKKNANADNADFELTATVGKPNRTIYLNINEQTAAGLTGGEVYVYDPAPTVWPLTTVAAAGTVKNAFSIPAIDANGDKAEFNVVWDNVNKRAVITFNVELPASTTITVVVSDTYFADVDNNPTAVTDWQFKTWYDQSPTVLFDVTTTTNTADLTPDAVFKKTQRAESKPVIEFTFSRKVLLRSNYQVLQNVDVLDLVTLVGPDPRTNPVVVGNIPLTVVKNVDGQTFQVQPTIDLVSEGDYTFTIVSDGDVTDAGGVDIDLVDDVRKYTLNGNMFDQTLAARTYTFEVEDNVTPNNGLAFYPADNAGPIKPQDPLFGTVVAGGGKYIVVDFGEAMQFGATYTSGQQIEIRRAYEFGSGPQSEGPGSIFLRIDKNTANLKIVGNRLWIPIVNGFENFMGYYVFIPANFVTDKAGWSYNGITADMNGGLGNQIWNFSTDDGTPPIVVDAYPPIWQPGVAYNDPARDDAYIAENVNIGADWWLKFDENVDINQNGGKLVLYKRDAVHGIADDGNAVLIMDIKDQVNVRLSGSDPQNNLSSNIITFNIPTTAEFEELIKSGVYYIRYYADAAAEGIVKDRPNGNFAANLTDYTWAFGTSSHASPQVTALTPLMNAAQEPVLTMTFDMNVLPGNGNIRIYEYNYAAGSSWNSRLVHTINVTSDAANLDAQVKITNNIVAITPSIKLDDNVAKYYVLIDAGAFTNTLPTKDFFKDLEGELGLFDDTDWAFNTVEDAAAPALVAGSLISNVDCGTMTNAIKAYITLTDYNGIKPGTGNFLVMKKNADGTYGAPVVIPANDARVSGWPVIGSPIVGKFPTAGMMLTIDLGAENLADRSVYVVRVENNAILDASRQPVAFAGINDDSWTFTVNDWTAPAFASATPAGNDVNPDTLITIVFSEPIKFGANPVVTLTGGAAPIVITADSIAEGNKVIVPVSGLTDKVTYTVSYDADFVMDYEYSTCTNVRGCIANTFTFTTDDNTAPIVTSASASKVGANWVISVTMSEEVQANAGLIKLVATNNTETLPVAVGVTTDNIVYDYTFPVATLGEGVAYKITVEAGAYKDAAVNANLTALFVSQPFNTGDNIAPALEATTPVSGTTMGSYMDAILAIFDEPVVIGSGAVTITDGSFVIPATLIVVDDSTLQVKPSVNLAFNTPYNVVFGANAVKDISGNGYVQATPWSFTIVDGEFNKTCINEVGNFIPEDGAIGVKASTLLTMTFCEKVVPGSNFGFANAKIKVYRMDNTGANTLFYTKAITAAMISADGMSVSLPLENMIDFKSYGVLVDRGAVCDEAGNPLDYEPLYSDPTFWNFTTGDNTAPTLEATPNTLPAADQAFDVVLTFDEPVINVNATNVKVDNGSIQSITGAGANWLVKVKGADGDVINLTVSPGTATTGILDASGRNNLDQEYVFTYTVGDNTNPTILAWEAAAGDQATTFNVKLKFSEPVTGVQGAVTVTEGNGTVSAVSTTEYIVTIEANEETDVKIDVSSAVIDSVGNAFAGESKTFRVGDFTPPTVSASPAPGVDMDSDFVVVLTFSDDAIVSKDDITVTGADYAVSENGDSVQIIGAADGADVVINVANTIVDEANNAIVAPLSFTYVVGDNTAPMVTVDPVEAQDTVNVFDLTLSFDEPVNIPAGAITVSAGTILIEPINDHVVYKATISAPDNSTVVMTLSDMITDMSTKHNPFVAKDFTYTIGDNTAPTVAVTPGSGTDLDNTFSVALAFSEDVTGVTLGEGVSVNGGNAVITGSGKDYTIAITAADKATVTVVLSNKIKDGAENSLAGETFVYTVGDNAAPTVVVTPATGTTNLTNNFTVSLAFSEAVTGVDAGVTVTGGTKVITGSGANYSVAITAADGADVSVALAASIKDASGNPLAASSYTYKVGDNTAPTVTVAPASGTEKLANNFNVTLTFNENVTGVTLGSGVIVAGGTATISGSGKAYTVAVSAADMASVSVVLTNKIVDAAGNKFAGDNYTYKVGDNTVPTVVVSPNAGNDMPNNFTVTLVFSETVTGVDAGVTVTGGTKVVTGTGANYSVAVTAADGATVTLALATSIKDAAGNALAASSYTYKVVQPAPVKTIAEIQGTGAKSLLEGSIVTTKGVVTGVDEGATPYGFFIQDAMAVNSGIYVYSKDIAATVSIGTSIEVTGTVTEYKPSSATTAGTLTELTSITSSKLINKVATIEPMVITADKVATEAYEGVLVKVAQLKATELKDSFDEWKTATNAGVTVKIDDQLYTADPNLGDFYDITGVVNYTYDEYKLAPRQVSDIVVVTSYEQIGLAMNIYPNPFDDYIQILNSSDVQITKAVISNIAGQVVMEVINPDNAIATSELRGGIYIITLHTADGIAKTERIIKR